MKYGTSLIQMALLWMLSIPACPGLPGDASNISLTSGCESCHGPEGHGYDAFPPIDGLGRQRFIEALHAYKEKHRHATVMDRIAKGYTDSEIERLADIFSPGSTSNKSQK